MQLRSIYKYSLMNFFMYLHIFRIKQTCIIYELVADDFSDS